MIQFNDTYIICNSSLVQKLRAIPQFKLDLGKSLLNMENKYNPGDVKIQKHHIFHNDILVKCGNIGSLNIYNSSKYKNNEICVCSDKILDIFTIEDNMSIYTIINRILDNFFKKHNVVKDVSTKVEEEKEIKEEVYNKPDKPLNEMTEAERISYVRNLK